MENTKHTPGPWGPHAFNSGEPQAVDMGAQGESFVAWSYSVGKGKKIIADVVAYSNGSRGEGYQRPSTREEAQANAALIASAPDLLEVATMVLETIDGGGPVVTFQDTHIAQLRAAIAKATAQ